MSTDVFSVESKYFEFIETHCDFLAIDDEAEFFIEYDVLSPIIRNVVLINYFIGCLMNGGLKQFFARSVGVSAPELSIALDQSEELEMKLLLDAATARFGDDYPRNSSDRMQMMKEMERASDEEILFSTQDSPMYDLVGFNAENLVNRQWNYICQNIPEIEAKVSLP